MQRIMNSKVRNGSMFEYIPPKPKNSSSRHHIMSKDDDSKALATENIPQR